MMNFFCVFFFFFSFLSRIKNKVEKAAVEVK